MLSDLWKNDEGVAMVTVFYDRHSKEWWGIQEDGQLAQIINTFYTFAP